MYANFGEEYDFTPIILKIMVLMLILLQLSIVFGKNNNTIPNKMNSDTFTSYQPGSLGNRNSCSMIFNEDSLSIFSEIYTDELKIDYIYSMIEIYNINDSLIFESKKAAEDANSVSQKLILCPFTYDDFRIKTWGFGHYVTKFNGSNRLYLFSSKIFESVFPDTTKSEEP